VVVFTTEVLHGGLPMSTADEDPFPVMMSQYGCR